MPSDGRAGLYLCWYTADGDPSTPGRSRNWSHCEANNTPLCQSHLPVRPRKSEVSLLSPTSAMWTQNWTGWLYAVHRTSLTLRVSDSPILNPAPSAGDLFSPG